MMTHRSTFAALLLLLAPLVAAEAGGPGGIGVLGDSYSDEYQFYPPDRSKARNWVEILASTRDLDFGPFSADDRGGPRGAGYAYNWALSGATSDDLLATGQHTGLASQVAAGKVQFVWIFVGGNDFLHALDSPRPEAELRRVPERALANIREAIGTILAASPDVKIVAATVPDLANLPEVEGWIRSGRLPRARIEVASVAIAELNDRLRSFLAGNPRVALLDLDLASRLGSLLGRRGIPVAGHKLVRTRAGDDLDSFFLADGRHPGLLAQGLLARAFVNTLNAKFAAGIRPMTDTDLLRFVASLDRPMPPAGLVADTGSSAISPPGPMPAAAPALNPISR